MRAIASAPLVVLALLCVAPRPSAQQGAALSPTALKTALEQRLTVAPRRLEQLLSPARVGVRINAVDVQRSSRGAQLVTIDFSQRVLSYEPSGNVERLMDLILSGVAPVTTAAGDVEFRFLVDGVGLDRLVQLPSSPPSRVRTIGRAGPIVVSAGHGWYFDEASARWSLQRDYYGGIVEDLVNWDIARYVLDELSAIRVDARPARHADLHAGPGGSGHPRWQESAKYFIRDQGAPANVSDYGANEYARDINSRPFYSNWVDATALISIHNNGGGGTGTETWFDETNGFAEESRRLAQIVNEHVVRSIRTRYDPKWPDRGLRSCNACKGETRLALRPAVLLEVAFMDIPRPDNAALHDDRFRRIVAQAVCDALQAWMGS